VLVSVPEVDVEPTDLIARRIEAMENVLVGRTGFKSLAASIGACVACSTQVGDGIVP
jgi:hypothetical protein